MKKFIKILIILTVILGIAALGYYRLNNWIEKNQAAKQAMAEAEKNKGAKIQEDQETLRLERVEKEKTDAYTVCMNKAYADYQASYNEECGKKIIDGQCQVPTETLSQLQGYYLFDKKQCEELKP